MPAQVLLPLLQVASAVGFGSSGIIVLIFLESSGPKKTPPPAVRVPVWERDVTPAENGHEGVCVLGEAAWAVPVNSSVLGNHL